MRETMKAPVREYRVTIETSHADIVISVYAKHRQDAIDFVKHTYRTKFARSEYKRIVSACLAKAVTPEVTEATPTTNEAIDEMVEQWISDFTRGVTRCV